MAVFSTLPNSNRFERKLKEALRKLQIVKMIVKVKHNGNPVTSSKKNEVHEKRSIHEKQNKIFSLKRMSSTKRKIFY